MPHDKLRRQLAFEAARLLYGQHETKVFRAKMKAAQRVCRGQVIQPADLPSHREIREQVLALARADRRQLHREDLGRLPEALARPAAASPPAGSGVDRFHAYHLLLLPLEQVREDRRQHPEGDLLYHSLQVFDLGRAQLPYDEEFLLAALLHEVGKAIDLRDPLDAALEALRGLITPRTAWLIQHHGEALALGEGTLGVRARRRLEAAEDFEELLLLARCDREGRRWGVAAPELDDALDDLRRLARLCGE